MCCVCVWGGVKINKQRYRERERERERERRGGRDGQIYAARERESHARQQKTHRHVDSNYM